MTLSHLPRLGLNKEQIVACSEKKELTKLKHIELLHHVTFEFSIIGLKALIEGGLGH